MPAAVARTRLLERCTGVGHVLRPGAGLAAVARPDAEPTEHEPDGDEHHEDDQDDREVEIASGGVYMRRVSLGGRPDSLQWPLPRTQSAAGSTVHGRAGRRENPAATLLSQGREAQVPSA